MTEIKVGQYYKNKRSDKLVKVISTKRYPPTNWSYVAYKFLDHDIFTIYKLQMSEFRRIYKSIKGYNTKLWKVLNDI